MILDWQNDAEHARQFEVLDAATGEVYPDMDIFYADDEKGIVRRILKKEDGQPYAAYASDHRTPLRDEDRFRLHDRNGNDISVPRCVAWEEVPAAIRIVPRAEVGAGA